MVQAIVGRITTIRGFPLPDPTPGIRAASPIPHFVARTPPAQNRNVCILSAVHGSGGCPPGPGCTVGTPRMTAKLAARYESLYQRALREWNRSKADRRTQTVVTSEPAGGTPTTTTTVRTERRTGNAACLGKALAAMTALEGLHCRERLRQERLENLERDAAGNEDEDGLTRTVKTTMTRSGRKLRTVVTTRSDAGRLAALRDEQEALDEKPPRLEARLGADERAADEEACAALKAEAAAAEEKLRIAEARLDPAERSAPACPPAIAPDEKGANAAGRARPVPISRKGNGDADTGSARSANGSAAEMPRNRCKSFLPNDLPLPGYDFASVYRSATLPNEVFQKGGAGKARKKAKGGRRKPANPPAQESAPRRGSAATLMQELDRIIAGQGASQSFPGLGGYTIEMKDEG